MSLYRLIYCSQASSEISRYDLKDILETSQKNNQATGITGLLYYEDSKFLQILEGDHRQVNQTYHRILRDPRHHDPLLIECLPVQKREFEVWSMQGIHTDDLATEQIRTFLLKYSGFSQFLPDTMTAEQCLGFMQELAYIHLLSDSFTLELAELAL
ncbi:MAG: BLUF domain-containing protein [Snowella sp.]|nr:BLUF domain-containing protein [Snowella sp.]